MRRLETTGRPAGRPATRLTTGRLCVVVGCRNEADEIGSGMYCRGCRKLLASEDARIAERDDEELLAIERQREANMRAQVVESQEAKRLDRQLDYEPPRRIFTLRKDRSGEVRRRTARRIRRGLCPKCGKPSRPGRKTCGTHKSKTLGNRKEQQRRLRQRRRELGRCSDCAQPAVPGRRRCRRHLDAVASFEWRGQASWSKSRRKEKKLYGECLDCTEAAEDDSVRCAKHREAARLAAQKRRRLGRDKALAAGIARRVRDEERETSHV